MKPALFPFVLISLLLLLSTSFAGASDIKQLQDDAIQRGAKIFQPAQGLSAETAAKLLSTADLFMHEKKHSVASPLYRKVAAGLAQPGFHCWNALARLAEEEASHGEASEYAMLASLSSMNNVTCRQQIENLLLMGTALGSRALQNEKWIPALLTSLDQGMTAAQACSESSDLQKRLSDLSSTALALKKRSERVEITSAEADVKGRTPGLCVTFTDALLPTSAVDYAQYVRTAPSWKAVFSVSGATLCMRGASWGSSYRIEVLPGMKTKEHVVKILQKADIKVTDRTPQLWFNRKNYVLPEAPGTKGSAALYSVNVDSAELSIYRIHERSLQGEFLNNYFGDNLQSWTEENLRDNSGSLVWKGDVDLAGNTNKVELNAVRLPPGITDVPGVYIMIVSRKGEGDRSDSSLRGTQWLVVSDIGLTSYTGEGGLTVSARSLASARPLGGEKITLYGRNNAPLDAVSTDAFGIAHFAPGLLRGKGGDRPSLVTAGTGGSHGFSFLQLSTPAFDLSDRGVSGRLPSGPIDGWSYTDRGIYRPGETVHSVTLLRDRQGRALASPLPLTLKLSGPDDNTLVERVVRPDLSGAWVQQLQLSKGARSGTWKVRLYADETGIPVASTSFEVKSFVPPRLEVKLAIQSQLTGGVPGEVKLQADYLFGAPGSGLTVNAEMRLGVAHYPFGNYKEFFFGDSFKPARFSFDKMTTDDKGGLLIPVQTDITTSQPLQGEITASVSDVDGRRTSARSTVPILVAPMYAGIRPETPGNVQKDSQTAFTVQLLDARGLPLQKKGCVWRLVREDHDWQWYRKDGSWQWEELVDDVELDGGELQPDTAGQVQLQNHVEEGWHRLELFDEKYNLLTNYRFYAGHRVEGNGRGPDRVELSLDNDNFLPGTTADLKISSPWKGEASLVLAGEEVRSVRNFKMETLQRSISIPVEKEWGAGTWAIVTVYRPGSAAEKGAARAVGVVWLGVDTADRTLAMTIHAPQLVRPRQVLEVPVDVRGATGKVFLTLAAVDEGVLQLTNFTSPDPRTWFFGRRRLAVDIRDFYGQLISASGGREAELHQGAGSGAGRRGAPESNIKVVSLFSGVVEVGADGRAVVPLDLPDYNGRLRLMVVGWSTEKFGAATMEMQVSDPVVLSASLPRFLARDDHSFVTVLVQNVTGKEGTYHVTARAEGAVRLDGTGEESFFLKKGERRSVLLGLTAAAIGKGEVECSVRGPGNYAVSSRLPIFVRGVDLPVLNRRYLRLESGRAFTVPMESLNTFYPEGAFLALDINSQAAIDVKGLLDQLDRYPYGCLEQLTSRALPLLYLKELEAFSGGDYPDLHSRVARAIDKILEMQCFDGSFALWDNHGPTEYWLSCYVMDFLTRARAKGYTVPDFFFNRGLSWLESEVQNVLSKENAGFFTCAQLVLAENGRGQTENLRYLYDNLHTELSGYHLAQLGAALSLVGELKRSTLAFTEAVQKITSPLSDPSFAVNGSIDDYYGSHLRDLSGVICLIGEFSSGKIPTGELWAELTQARQGRRWFSTQEQAAMVMAATTLREQSEFFIMVNTEIQAGKTLRLTRTAAEMKVPLKITNRGKGDVWLTFSEQGTPVKSLASSDSGLRVSRHWYHLDGTALDLRSMKQGEMVVVVVEVQEHVQVSGQALLINLLPAGLEYDRVIEPGDEELPLFGKQLNRSLLYNDGMDDRFITAWETQSNPSSPFRTAHLLRVVTPGEYTIPAVEAEMMYAPEKRGRGIGGRLSISR
ncbi:MAG: alpha-2-macroglobulin family protein [Desulforhopalus sp.]|nr:alpha-2-macroglobulin family protein [Desulforhopalus sp.]